ncbi:hypothetical protein FQN57_003655 [Myotisia sp. PD_48]|nr:hypothetical protein FQN57_003655 [Myotisia sp. PD_48]
MFTIHTICASALIVSVLQRLRFLPKNPAVCNNAQAYKLADDDPGFFALNGNPTASCRNFLSEWILDIVLITLKAFLAIGWLLLPPVSIGLTTLSFSKLALQLAIKRWGRKPRLNAESGNWEHTPDDGNSDTTMSELSPMLPVRSLNLVRLLEIFPVFDSLQSSLHEAELINLARTCKRARQAVHSYHESDIKKVPLTDSYYCDGCETIMCRNNLLDTTSSSGAGVAIMKQTIIQEEKGDRTTSTQDSRFIWHVINAWIFL